jgi:Domain of unknown function (DUF4372)/Transposase DDE domain
MNQGKYVFSQIMSFVDHNDFLACVNRYNGDHKVKDFSCWKQFLCMAFGQLTHRESLSDTIICLSANAGKLYHAGIGKIISKSTLSKANENRNWKIYADLGMLLIKEAKSLYAAENELEVDLTNNVFAIDATTIDLCLSLMPWAKFRKTKGAIKLHTMLDLKTAIPHLVHITSGKVHELTVLDQMAFEQDSFYVMDRGYIDFPRFYKIHLAKAFFITRTRHGLRFSRHQSFACDKSTGIKYDQAVKPTLFYAAKNYPEKMRRIKYFDKESNKELIFLTNNFCLKATEIAQLYKHRWKIELFFKWIKQHLKIKSFWGHSANAVKSQIWIAIAVYVLIAIIKRKLELKQSLYEILQIISISIFDKTPLNQLFTDTQLQYFKELKHNQLEMFD